MRRTRPGSGLSSRRVLRRSRRVLLEREVERGCRTRPDPRLPDLLAVAVLGRDDLQRVVLGVRPPLAGGQATALNSIAAVYHARGDTTRALYHYQQALELARQIPSPWDQAHALAGLGRCAKADGDLSRATGLLRQAHQIFADSGAAEAADIAADIAAIHQLAVCPAAPTTIRTLPPIG